MLSDIDGSALDHPSHGVIGIVFRSHLAVFRGALVQNIGYAMPLEAEFNAFMIAIEKALEMHMNNIWVECDSLIVVKAFHQDVVVPWRMHNRWFNYKILARQMECICSHTPREGNMVADVLAKNGQGLSMYSSQRWDSPPAFALPMLDRDKLGLSFSRIQMT
ncbi:putative ribonuclease H-like domain-containing protein [Medicago truncatula]|uniref:Putative ribonuclease H-like domain-containing protein n=1 Tax=Medicago truncatula TaxID=3880 RepID=A0A396HMV5_MEDTR|nr:uncharacterized protein LOC112422861 [Medicago truncatula]RHN52685.1 putative ribonuclease H-like domain-containing protein [Medicago truncatula]